MTENLFLKFLEDNLDIVNLSNYEIILSVPDDLIDFYNSIQVSSFLLGYLRKEKKFNVFSITYIKRSFYNNLTFNDNFQLDKVQKIG